MTTATAELIEVQPIQKDSAKEYELKAAVYVSKSKELIIENQNDYEQAANDLKVVKSIYKTLEEARKKITTPLDIAKKAVMDLFRDPSTALEGAELVIKRKMIEYTNEQERRRRVEEERLQREAKAAEEKERKRLQDIADRAKASGKDEKAQEFEQKAQEVFIPAPVVAPTVQKVAGVSMKQNWKARILDVNKVPRNYMIVNESMLDKLAKATKGSLTIEGVEFYSEDVLASR